MELHNVDQTEFSSIFGNPNNNTDKKFEPKESGFSGTGTADSLFVKPKTDIKEEIAVLTPEEQAKVLEDKKEIVEDVSLFENKNAIDEAKFTDVKSIFEELIKNNQLLPLEDEKLDTPADIQALIQANVVHQVEELKKDQNNTWYASKSPAWRIVAEFAEKVQHPSELLPFIQSVQTIDSVSELDPKNEVDAEKIIRMALISRNESQDIIDDTIATYKENGKISNIAEKYQPSLVQQEQIKMQNLVKQKEQEEINNYNMIKQIHEDAVKVLETPFLGKHKMKKEEKAAIYNMIASPDSQTGGYKIFSAIDNLYETKNFDKLRMIALLLQDDKAYNSYVGLDVANNTAENIMRRVKTTATAHSTSDLELPPTIKNQPIQNNNFQKSSGFGYFQK